MYRAVKPHLEGSLSVMQLRAARDSYSSSCLFVDDCDEKTVLDADFWPVDTVIKGYGGFLRNDRVLSTFEDSHGVEWVVRCTCPKRRNRRHCIDGSVGGAAVAASRSTRYHLKLTFLNARSIVKRGALQSIHTFARLQDVGVIGVGESWLHDGIADAELSDMDSFAVFRKDRGSRGGGLLFLVRKELNPVVVPVGDTDVEILCIDVSVKNFRSRLILVYLSGTESYAADQSAMHSATSLL